MFQFAPKGSKLAQVLLDLPRIAKDAHAGAAYGGDFRFSGCGSFFQPNPLVSMGLRQKGRGSTASFLLFWACSGSCLALFWVDLFRLCAHGG